MKNYCYPTVSIFDGLQIKAEQVLANQKNSKFGVTDSVKKSHVIYRGSGGMDIASALVTNMVAELNTLRNTKFSGNMKIKDSRLDEFEGLAAGIIHKHLNVLPLEVLTDEDFWRFIAVLPMMELVAWRHPTLGNNNFGLTQGRGFLRCLPYRMFIRADIAFRSSNGTDYDLASNKDFGQDQWASHVIAQQYGMVPILVKSMLHYFAGIRSRKVKQPTQIDREIAKELNQIRSIQVFEFFEKESEFDQIISEIGVKSELSVNGLKK